MTESLFFVIINAEKGIVIRCGEKGRSWGERGVFDGKNISDREFFLPAEVSGRAGTSGGYGKIFGEKQMFLLATSPGQRGGASVLEIATKRFPFDGATVVETFSLPFFYENFDSEKGILNNELQRALLEKVEKIKSEFF